MDGELVAAALALIATLAARVGSWLMLLRIATIVVLVRQCQPVLVQLLPPRWERAPPRRYRR